MDTIKKKLILTLSADDIPVIAEVDPAVYNKEETDTWIDDSFLDSDQNHPLKNIFEDVTEWVDFSERLDSQVFRIWKYTGKTWGIEGKEVLGDKVLQVLTHLKE
jgi:hypothetical protein